MGPPLYRGCKKVDLKRSNVLLAAFGTRGLPTFCLHATRMLLSNEANIATSVYKISASSNYSRSQKCQISRRPVRPEKLHFIRVYYTALFLLLGFLAGERLLCLVHVLFGAYLLLVILNVHQNCDSLPGCVFLSISSFLILRHWLDTPLLWF